MKILLFCGSLAGGGAERSVVLLAKGFHTRSHEVTVVTCRGDLPDLYTLDKGIRRETLHLGRFLSIPWYDVWGNLRRLYMIRRCLQGLHPDLVISFLDGLNELFLLATPLWRVKKLISCQVDIRCHPTSNRRWYYVRSLVYPLADRIVFLDEAQAQWAAGHFRGWKTTGIPNPVTPIPAQMPPHPMPGKMRRHVVAMGRLEHQKGFDLLIRAFSRIAPAFPEWGVVILGEGSLRVPLEGQIAASGLADRIILPGVLSQPFSLLTQGDIFAFPSRYEGQGMALMEAMACGLPAVSFDCPSGPSGIIKDMVDGFLVPPGDIEAFARALETLMRNEDLRKRMGNAAKDVADRFGIDTIIERWLRLFRELGLDA
ncbi:MAG: glycosyltransferase family 4 protein [bacterium]